MAVQRVGTPHTLLVSLLDEMRCVGLLYLAASLRREGFPCSLLLLPKMEGEGGSERELAAVLGFVRELSPRVVGFGLMTCHFRRARSITQRLRQVVPDAMVVWGGVHPTLLPEECIAEADAVCVGEGEDSLVDLVRCLRDGSDHTAVPNFWFRQGGRTVRNPPRRLREDLDALPFPFHDFAHASILHNGAVHPLDHALYRAHMNWGGDACSIFTTRGCPYGCTYCCNSALRRIYEGKYVRRRSVASVLHEMEAARRLYPYTRSFNIQDDSFLLNDDAWLDAFCRQYRERIGLPLLCRVIPAMVDDRRLGLLKEAGLQWAIAGLQSGSERICKEVYRRGTTNQAFLSCARMLHRHGIFGIYDVILDGPFDGEADTLATLEVLRQVPRPFTLQVFSMILFPGTQLKELCDEKGVASNADPYARGFSRIRETYLNRLVMVIPFTPDPLVGFFLRHRHAAWSAALLTRYYRVYLAVFVTSRQHLRRFRFVPRAVKWALKPLFRWKRAALDVKGPTPAPPRP